MTCGEPGALSGARRVREAGRGNGLVARPAPRLGPTSLIDTLPAGRRHAGDRTEARPAVWPGTQAASRVETPGAADDPGHGQHQRTPRRSRRPRRPGPHRGRPDHRQGRQKPDRDPRRPPHALHHARPDPLRPDSSPRRPRPQPEDQRTGRRRPVAHLGPGEGDVRTSDRLRSSRRCGPRRWCRSCRGRTGRTADRWLLPSRGNRLDRKGMVNKSTGSASGNHQKTTRQTRSNYPGNWR